MLDSAMPSLIALFLDSLPVIVEIRLQTHERIRQILFLGRELLHLLRRRRLPAAGAGRRACFAAARFHRCDHWLRLLFFSLTLLRCHD